MARQPQVGRPQTGVTLVPTARPEPAVLTLLTEKPEQLLAIPDDQFGRLVEEFLETGAPVLKALRRGAGILAWAARHHLPDNHYGPWHHGFALRFGVSDDSLTRYRDQAIRDLNLPVAMETERRSRAKLASAAANIRRNAETTPAREKASIELGDVGSTSVRQAVTLLVLTSAETLAESASTAELRSLATLIDEAIADQVRASLRARAAARRPRPARSA